MESSTFVERFLIDQIAREAERQIEESLALSSGGNETQIAMEPRRHRAHYAWRTETRSFESLQLVDTPAES